MKCQHCAFEITDSAQFCSNCGSSFEQQKKEEVESIETKERKATYCRHCGAELFEESAFCVNCGSSVKESIRPNLQTADWGKRFVAWVIDVIILGLVLGWIALPGYTLIPGFQWIPFLDLGTRNVINFLYWMIMEGIYGQSIGKMAMKIKVVKLNGTPMNLTFAAIESFGKAFLIPIDCIIGWILYPDKKQRLFNFLSETTVVNL